MKHPGFVDVVHPAHDTAAVVPKRALPYYLDRGYELVPTEADSSDDETPQGVEATAATEGSQDSEAHDVDPAVPVYDD